MLSLNYLSKIFIIFEIDDLQLTYKNLYLLTKKKNKK